jgi:hypothetical protein
VLDDVQSIEPAFAKVWRLDPFRRRFHSGQALATSRNDCSMLKLPRTRFFRKSQVVVIHQIYN